MSDAYIALGSNIERDKNYLEALRRLTVLGDLRGASAVYETAPIGSSREYFYNGAVRLATRLSAPELKHALRRIEAQLGRVRTEDRNAPRTIDLDLVLFDRECRDDLDLQLPDPLILQRPFLAQALAELNPDYVHPVDGRTLAEIAHRSGSQAGASSTAAENQTRVDPALTAQVQDLLKQYYVGEISHA